MPEGGRFRVTVDLDGPKKAATVRLRVQTLEKGTSLAVDDNPGAKSIAPYGLPEGGVRVVFPEIDLKASPAERLEVWVEEDGVAKPYGVRFAYVERVE